MTSLWQTVSTLPSFGQSVGGYRYSGQLLLWIDGHGPVIGRCTFSVASNIALWTTSAASGSIRVTHWIEIKGPSE